MRTSVILVGAPATEPCTVAELKTWARIDTSTEDSMLGDLIGAARQEAEKFLGRALVTQTWELTLDLQRSSLDALLGDGVYDLPITTLYSGLPRVITLPYAPASSITSVKTYGVDDTETTMTASTYSLDAAGSRLVLDYGISWPSDLRVEACVKIRYVTGYGAASAVPYLIKVAIMAYALALYESRGICDGQSADPLAMLHSQLFSFKNFVQ